MHKITDEGWVTESCNSGAKVAVLNAKNHKLGLGHRETCNSGAKGAVFNAKKTIGEVWDP